MLPALPHECPLAQGIRIFSIPPVSVPWAPGRGAAVPVAVARAACPCSLPVLPQVIGRGNPLGPWTQALLCELGLYLPEHSFLHL